MLRAQSRGTENMRDLKKLSLHSPMRGQEFVYWKYESDTCAEDRTSQYRDRGEVVYSTRSRRCYL